MLKLLKKLTLISVPNTTSIAFGLPEVPKMVELLKKTNYDQVEVLYNGLKNDERTLLIDGVALNKNTVKLVLNWYKANPTSGLVNLFVGAAYTFLAWEARSAQLAKDLSDSQIQGFFEYIELAYSCLEIAKQLKPEEAEVYARLIRVNMGLSDKQEAIDNFDALVKLDSKHLGGHLFMANLLAPKWLGSWEEMEAFTGQFKQPEKNDVRYVVYMHYILERYLEAYQRGDNKAINLIIGEFLSQLKAVYKYYNMEEISSLQRYYLHNYFSYLFHSFKEKKLRNIEIDQMGNHITYIPWAYEYVEGERDLKALK